jgi:hypothetical protein
LIVAPRQSVQNLNDALALPVNSDNHASIATAVSHPDCRSLLIQIVALQFEAVPLWVVVFPNVLEF